MRDYDQLILVTNDDHSNVFFFKSNSWKCNDHSLISLRRSLPLILCIKETSVEGKKYGGC